MSSPTQKPEDELKDELQVPDVQAPADAEETKTEEQGTSADQEKESESPKRTSTKATWSPAEDEALMLAVIEDRKNRGVSPEEDEEEDWDEIAKAVPDKTPVACLRRYMRLNRKEGSASSIGPIVDKSDESEERDDPSEPPPAKKAKKDADEVPGEPLSKWNTDEMELLKKLVDQYQDSECLT